MDNYKDLFTNIETTVRNLSRSPSRYDEFKKYENRSLSDSEYFDILVAIVFYSGFKAETVTKKMDLIRSYFPDFQSVASYGDEKIEEIMKDSNMIKNEKKIRACVNNAKVFKGIIKDFGSFEKYVNSFKAKESLENLMLFKKELEDKFDYLGGVTSYHFLMDIGFPVLKPDRVITRIFKRIGLIENEKQFMETVKEGRKFVQETGYPIRYIDIIFVKYGQIGEDTDFGLDGGICLKEKPKCDICSITKYCEFYASKK